MSRRFAGAGMTRRPGGRGTPDGPPPSGVNPLTDIPGLLHWWQVSAATVTLNGSNISALAERVAGSANMSEATAAQQPQYNASGGPNDKPYLTLQDSARNINATVSYSAGNRVGMFAVVRQASSGQASTIVASGGGNRFLMNLDASSRFRFECAFTGGAQIINTTTSPANNGAWRIRAIIPAASGALSQIDRTTTNPTFTGNDTLQSWTNVGFGFINAIVCAGDGASIMTVDLTVDSATAIAKVYEYYGQEYAL